MLVAARVSMLQWAWSTVELAVNKASVRVPEDLDENGLSRQPVRIMFVWIMFDSREEEDMPVVFRCSRNSRDFLYRLRSWHQVCAG